MYKLLAWALLAMNAADVGFTHLALNGGAEELNPFTLYMIELAGLSLVLAFKVLFGGILIVYASSIRRAVCFPTKTLFLFAFAAYTALTYYHIISLF